MCALKKKSSSLAAGLISGILGGVVFVVVFLVTTGFLTAFLAAAAVFIAGHFLLSSRGRPAPINVDGVSPEMFRKSMEEGRARVRELEDFIRRVWPGPVRDQLSEIGRAHV